MFGGIGGFLEPNWQESLCLSMPCICDLVDELIADGKLIETGTVSGARGRPRVMVDINPNGAPIAGAFVALTSAEIVVANSAGDFLTRRTVSIDPTNSTPKECIASIVNGIERCVEAAQKEVGSLSGVGLSISDIVNHVLGIVESSNESFTWWDGLPVTDMVSEALGVPVYADHDMRAAAVTSEWFSVDTRGNAAYISIGNGIGFAFVEPHGVLRGTHDMAGQLEHITVDPDGPMCNCGNRGCLRVTGTDTSFVRRIWPDLPADFNDMPLAERAVLMQRGLDLAMSGDRKAMSALQYSLKNLGQGVANVINMLDPRVVYILGNLIDPAPDLISDMIRKEALQRVIKQLRGTEIKAIPDWLTFELRGSIGLVLGNEFRNLHGDNLNAGTAYDFHEAGRRTGEKTKLRDPEHGIGCLGVMERGACMRVHGSYSKT